MLRVGYVLWLALSLLRCIYSEEVRQELRVYRENTSSARKIFDLIGALFGLVLLSFLLFGFYKGMGEIYRAAASH